MSKTKTRLGDDPFKWMDKTTDPQQAGGNDAQATAPAAVATTVDKPNVVEKPTVEKPRPGRKKIIPKTADDRFTKMTLVVREKHLEKLRDKAYWDRKTIKRVMDKILSEYFEKETVQPRPKEEVS